MTSSKYLKSTFGNNTGILLEMKFRSVDENYDSPRFIDVTHVKSFQTLCTRRERNIVRQTQYNKTKKCLWSKGK